MRAKNDTKARQALTKSCNLAGLRSSPQSLKFPPKTQLPEVPQVQQSQVTPISQLPQKVARTRTISNNSSMTSPSVCTRKRTSSGRILVDALEPPPKKTQVSPSQPAPHPSDTNGRKKTETTPTGKKDINKDLPQDSVHKDKVIETFDSQAKSKCATAFKESDSWD